MSNIMKYDEAAASKVLSALDEAIQTIGGSSIPALEAARNSANTLEVGKISSIADALSAAKVTVSRLEAFKRKVKSYMDDTRQFDLDAANLLRGLLGDFEADAEGQEGSGEGGPGGLIRDDNGNLCLPDGTPIRRLASAGMSDVTALNRDDWELVQLLYARDFYAMIDHEAGDKGPDVCLNLMLSYILQGKQNQLGIKNQDENEIPYNKTGNSPAVGFCCATLYTYPLEKKYGIKLPTGPERLLKSNSMITIPISQIGYENVPWGSALGRMPTVDYGSYKITTQNADGTPIQSHTTGYAGTQAILYQGKAITKSDDVLYIGPVILNATGPEQGLQALPLPNPGYNQKFTSYTVAAWPKGMKRPTEPVILERIPVVERTPPKDIDSKYLYPVNASDADFDDDDSRYEQHLKNMVKPVIEQAFYDQQNRVPKEFEVLEH